MRERRIKSLKESVQAEESFLEKCKEYDKNPSFVNSVNVSFSKDIDVSAKTVNGEIFLNDRLFNKSWEEQMRYLIHELVHCMQQEDGKVNGKTDKEDYLDDKNEQEAFTTQISYMCEHNNAEEIQEYIENLLDHHNIQGDERKEKAKKLVENL